MEPPVREAPETPPPPATVEELHLLISEMDDELSSYRWREAVWISLVFHVVVFLCVVFAPKWFPSLFTTAVVIPIPLADSHKDVTFLQLPTDQQHVTTTPKTDIASDKDRIAQSRRPVIDRDQLRKLLNAQQTGSPKPPTPAPQPPQQAMQQPPQQAAPQQAGGQQPGGGQGNQPTQQATNTSPLPSPGSGPSPFKTGMAPGIQHAIESAAATHGSPRVAFRVDTGAGGDFGSSRLQPRTDLRGDVDILSDTMGVDFGPYLQRVIYRVKTHWYNLIPEIARPPIMKTGKLTIDFAILPDGNVAGMSLYRTSNDSALDRAAWGGITDSILFDHLPSDFHGNYLQLRFTFYYNLDPNADRLK